VKVLGLCSGFPKARQLDRALQHVAEAELRFLIPNAHGRSLPRFFGGLVSGLLRAGPGAWLWAVRAVAGRRVSVTPRELGDSKVLEKVRRLAPDVGLHGAGVIYRQPLLECFGLGILNAHIGLLPEYRGRSVMEWSLLNGDETGITTFLVNEGIDTGPIVLRRVVDVRGKGSVGEAKRYLFSLDGQMYAEALAVLQSGDFAPSPQNAADGTRWYPMSQLFTRVVDEILVESSP
jgi:methionyl-tRNA formyltransferase